MQRSTKEKVIAKAQEDPFLTVDELAGLAATTPRYVRTILSEASLSLTRMRKKYARNLERRLGQKPASPNLPTPKELKISKIKDSNLALALQCPPAQELFQLSHVARKGSAPSYMQLITAAKIRVPGEYSSLREFLPYPFSELGIGGQLAETVPAWPHLATVLDLATASPVLKISTYLHRGDKPVALELRWLAWEGVVLRWSAHSLEIDVS